MVYYEYKIVSHKGFCVFKKNIFKVMIIVLCSLSSGVQSVSWPFQKAKSDGSAEISGSFGSDISRQKPKGYLRITDSLSNTFNKGFTNNPVFNNKIVKMLKPGLPIIVIVTGAVAMDAVIGWWLDKYLLNNFEITHNHRTDPLVIMSAAGCAMAAVAIAYVAYNYYGDDQASEKPKKLEKKKPVLKK